MHFPISGVAVNPVLLAGIGFLVGILGGFFGVGGGFIATPLMFWAGVPMNFVVGTSLAHMSGKSIVAVRRHRALGHVDFKLGAVMVTGSLAGVELGAHAIERLKTAGVVDTVIGLTYVPILLFIGAFTAWESLRALRMIRTDSLPVEEALGFDGFSRRVHSIGLPPRISFPTSGIASISLWAVLGVAFLAGIVTGALGVGGGFVRVPMLIYLLGVPTHVAVGTDLLDIVMSAGFGTLTHSLKGNVDMVMALVLLSGAVLGAQIGASLTRFFTGPRIRLLFSGLPFLGAVMVLIRLLSSGMI
jgi:uncharacterized membrane protein YfcA